jgi:hypothetical protein
VTAVTPGTEVKLADVLTSESFELRDISASHYLARRELVLTRIDPGRGAWRGDGGIALFDPGQRREMVDALATLGIR